MSCDHRSRCTKIGQIWAETQADRPLLGRPAWHLHIHDPGFKPVAMQHTQGALSRGLCLGSTGYTERLQHPSKDPQDSPRPNVFKQPTSLEDARRQSGVSAKPEAEMGQREAAGLRQAGWPSSYNRQQKPTVNHLQEMIRALDQKAVATWRHPQAGRPRGGRPAPHGGLSG